MIMKQDFHYDLPEHLIAQHSLAQRDGSRLLVLPRSAEMATSHRLFADMPQILRPGDCLVMNNTKVMPARL